MYQSVATSSLALDGDAYGICKIMSSGNEASRYVCLWHVTKNVMAMTSDFCN